MLIRLLCPLCLAALLIGCNKSKPSPEPPENEPKKVVKQIDPIQPVEPTVNVDPDVPFVVETRPVGELEIADLIQCLGHADLAKVNASSDELVRRGNEVVPQLIAALDDANYHVRAGAVFALGRFGPAAADALPKLKQLRAQDEREAVRDAAAFAIDAIENG